MKRTVLIFWCQYAIIFISFIFVLLSLSYYTTICINYYEKEGVNIPETYTVNFSLLKQECNIVNTDKTSVDFGKDLNDKARININEIISK